MLLLFSLSHSLTAHVFLPIIILSIYFKIFELLSYMKKKIKLIYSHIYTHKFCVLWEKKINKINEKWQRKIAIQMNIEKCEAYVGIE